jgi:hypothetical protein
LAFSGFLQFPAGAQFSFDIHARFEEIEFGELLFNEKSPCPLPDRGSP